MAWVRPSNDLPFSSERQGRLRAYHGREEPRAQPAASRHETTCDRTRVAFVCCNGRFGSQSALPAATVLAAAFIERPVQASAFTLTDATAIHPTQRGQLDAVLRALVPIVPGLGSTARRYCKAHPWSACHSAVVPAAHEDQHERAKQQHTVTGSHRFHYDSRLPNDLPFSSERQGRVQAYHGREEPRAQPAASRHQPTRERRVWRSAAATAGSAALLRSARLFSACEPPGFSPQSTYRRRWRSLPLPAKEERRTERGSGQC